MAGVAKDRASPHVHVIFIRLQSNGARFNANFTVIKGNYPFADEKSSLSLFPGRGQWVFPP